MELNFPFWAAQSMCAVCMMLCRVQILAQCEIFMVVNRWDVDVVLLVDDEVVVVVR
jgi:hypothetical protein